MDSLNPKTSPESYIDLERIKGWQSFVYSLPYPGKNHDAWSLRENTAVVGDGATPLSADWGKDLYHWANTLSGFFADNAKDTSKTLSEVWADSIEFVNSIYNPIGYRRTMGCSQIRFNEDSVEILTVGDTAVSIMLRNQEILHLFDSRLARWEEIADAMIERNELSKPQAAWHNRLKVGQLDGYHVISDDPDIGKEAIFKALPAEDIASIIISSDGLWRLVDGNISELFPMTNPSKRDSLQELISEVSPITDDLTFIRIDRLS